MREDIKKLLDEHYTSVTGNAAQQFALLSQSCGGIIAEKLYRQGDTEVTMNPLVDLQIIAYLQSKGVDTTALLQSETSRSQ